MKAKITFEIEIPDKSMDVNTLSAQIRELTQKKAKELFCLSLERYEASLLRKHRYLGLNPYKRAEELMIPGDSKEWMGIKLAVYYWGKALRGIRIGICL